MKIVAALGGNALLERGEVPEAEIQQKHVESAMVSLAPLALQHELIVTHGNGPQVGLLALESARDPDLPHPYPFDVLGAQTQGMIGYLMLQALENSLPGHPVAALVTQIIVEQDDPAFGNPTKFVGPVYEEGESRRMARRFGWQVRKDGSKWRRVVASPEPVEIVEMTIIRALMDGGTIVICGGGGGIPVYRGTDGNLHGVEAVVDKDLTAALLARSVNADALLLLTDVPAVEIDFGTAQARPIHHATAGELDPRSFPAGSMGPKIEAARRFVAGTDAFAAIGRLDDAAGLVQRVSGTIVTDR